MRIVEQTCVINRGSNQRLPQLLRDLYEELLTWHESLRSKQRYSEQLLLLRVVYLFLYLLLTQVYFDSFLYLSFHRNCWLFEWSLLFCELGLIFCIFVDLDHYTTGLVCDWRRCDRSTVWRNADLPSTVSLLLCGHTRDIAPPTCRRFPTDLSFKETSILPLRKLFIQHLVYIYENFNSLFNFTSHCLNTRYSRNVGISKIKLLKLLQLQTPFIYQISFTET